MSAQILQIDLYRNFNDRNACQVRRREAADAARLEFRPLSELQKTRDRAKPSIEEAEECSKSLLERAQYVETIWARDRAELQEKRRALIQKTLHGEKELIEAQDIEERSKSLLERALKFRDELMRDYNLKHPGGI